MNWQPIETAPKDGTHILAYRVLVGIRYTNLTNPPAVVHWFDDPEEPGFYTSVNERAPEHPFNPTHWKPLDAPPAPGQFAFDEEDCPGHIASERDAKVCARCGLHIDSLRPDDDTSAT